MIENPAKTIVPIHELLARRRSGRAYDPDRPVSREQLISVFEAARWSPSCFNDQPWRYLVWIKNENGNLFLKAFECLTEANRKRYENIPVLMASLAHDRFERKGNPNRWGQHDTGAASENLLLQAIALGLMAHEMGGFDKDKLRESFGIPDEFEPMAMIALGYPAEAESLDPEALKWETLERVRKPLNETFFMGVWGNGIEIK